MSRALLKFNKSFLKFSVVWRETKNKTRKKSGNPGFKEFPRPLIKVNGGT